MTACKDLRERILNSEQYLNYKKRKDEEFEYSQKIDRYKEEIMSWFKGLPKGHYIIYGPKVKITHIFHKDEEKILKVWDVWNSGGSNVYFSAHAPESKEIEWIYENREQVCKEIEFRG